jgi:putative sterol carrier protein
MMDDAALAKAVEALKEKVAGADSFGATVLFDFEGEGTIFVDGNQEPPTVAPASGEEADCTITASEDDFREMMSGDLDPTAAYMTGKMKIDGDMGAAMAVGRLLG